MTHKLPNMFTFHKSNGKWKSDLNPEWIFQMYTAKGVPVDMVEDLLANMSFEQRMTARVNSWARFIEENPQYKEEVEVNRKVVYENKEKVMELIKSAI